MVQHQVEHQLERAAQFPHVRPVAQRRIHSSIVDHRKTIVGCRGIERQQVNRAEPVFQAVIGKKVPQGAQRTLPRGANLIRVRDEHDVALIPAGWLPSGEGPVLFHEPQKPGQATFRRRTVDVVEPSAQALSDSSIHRHHPDRGRRGAASSVRGLPIL